MDQHQKSRSGSYPDLSMDEYQKSRSGWSSKSRSGSYPDLSMIFHPNLEYR